MSVVYVDIMKLVMTQVTVLWITAIDFMCFNRAVIVIALPIVFVAMQSQIFFFCVIFQCKAMAVAVFRLRMQHLIYREFQVKDKRR